MNCLLHTATSSIAIEIGGVAIAFCSEDTGFLDMVRTRYCGFARNPDDAALASPFLTFEIEILDRGSLTTDADVRVWRQGQNWYASRGDFRAEFDLLQGTGRIQQELNPYALNSILRIVHTIYLSQQGGFLLHAASAVRHGAAFLFSGISGAGKTTISRCAPPDVALLTDEISYVCRTGFGYRAWGTPFAGEMGRPGENISAPIARLFFLEKDSQNRMLDIGRADALRMLLRNVLFFCTEEDLVQLIFASACDFLEQVSVHSLAFRPDQTVWDLIL